MGAATVAWADPQTLAAYVQLANRYGHHVDQFEAPQLGPLMAPDVVWDGRAFGKPRWEGRETVVEGFESDILAPIREAGGWVMHATSSHVLLGEEDGDLVAGCLIIALSGRPGKEPGRTYVRYDDRLVRIDGTLVFSSRVAHLVHSG